MKTWLCLDMHFLAWRSFHTTGQLRYLGVSTGVMYGVFRDLINFTDLHDTKHVMFAFDKAPYRRCEVLKTYKANRKDFRHKDEFTEKNYIEVKNQIVKMRDRLLKEVGFRNVFSQKGYEADDVIASFIQRLPKQDHAVIISADQDLYQLLDPGRVICWNPNSKKPFTAKSMEKQFGVKPSDWAWVKAAVGCPSDNVKGIMGIGEKTACKYLTGELKSSSSYLKKIVEGQDVIERNLPLVKLPYEGCKVFKPKKDEVTKDGWRRMLKRLGMKSMIDRFPAGAK